MTKGELDPIPSPERDSDSTPINLSSGFLLELVDVVTRNKRVRRIMSRSLRGHDSRDEFLEELIQDLTVRILGSMDVGKPDFEEKAISRISAIELPQLLNEFLKRELPERFRISKRIWKIIRKSDRFSVLSPGGGESVAYDGSNLVGLSEWSVLKPVDLDSFDASKFRVSRNLRFVGRGGHSQLIISEANLEKLLVGILEFADGHVPLSRLKALAVSCLQLGDPGFVSLNELGVIWMGNTSDNPHEMLVRKEEMEGLREKEREFLMKLKKRCGTGASNFNRVVQVLSLCVLSEPPFQRRQVAKRLRISTSVVSRDITLIREVCRSLALHDEELRLMLKERLAKSLEGLVRKSREDPQ